MTSTADTTQHPDVSEISDLTEGILPPSRTADVRRHLDRCDLCADVYSSLEEIRGLLGTLPGPARMPIDVAERIEAALAAEALLDAAAPNATPSVSRETATEASAVETGRPKTAERPVSAPAGRPSGSTGPGRASVRRRRHVVVSAVCGLAAVGLGALFAQTVDTGSGTSRTLRTESLVTPGDTRFSGSALTDKVRALLASPARDRVAEPSHLRPGAESPEVFSSMIDREIPQIPACVRRGLDRSDQPLAVERGEYQGRPAYLVVLPHARAETRVDVYVVDASCTTVDASGTADLLLKQSHPRP
ncbi:hypothetical protein M4914_18400 [Streptomyces somaliensis DSM 40738]|uniref:Zinc-finger domain-containing protein n=1 Tax=Streptomyces somaliensis (strain ATCC 33201 / DSM 40738 / JCM 12659 / KCTC 9044 / NCTC 11332 / NRRL B-12077 / IP 733) TaxID=1134445 RepID=A0AA44ICA5_STRE0|nr:hypothetical protein [Streptomyces somaliensis DSM 40738]NKY13207.1 hypothetical protein [Streptomyces somaliensis DSM 40738]